eukprot:414513-Pelagomonas_calceolata.AAC.5
MRGPAERDEASDWSGCHRVLFPGALHEPTGLALHLSAYMVRSLRDTADSQLQIPATAQGGTGGEQENVPRFTQDLQPYPCRTSTHSHPCLPTSKPSPTRDAHPRHTRPPNHLASWT